ncbi:MAG: hypothetical protein LBB64_04680 [Dysgonamonadaceae bacterium]|jgi:hypothetical protein|nr:hypothetical protein [Dysgonamonadaceae bacterium]
MAQPIKETPILTGNDARRFEQRMKEHQPISRERLAEMDKSYDIFKKIATFSLL